MIYDCHLHTELSGDSNTPIGLQIEKAIELGMKEMCITDHVSYTHLLQENTRVPLWAPRLPTPHRKSAVTLAWR